MSICCSPLFVKYILDYSARLPLTRSDHSNVSALPLRSKRVRPCLGQTWPGRGRQPLALTPGLAPSTTGYFPRVLWARGRPQNHLWICQPERGYVVCRGRRSARGLAFDCCHKRILSINLSSASEASALAPLSRPPRPSQTMARRRWSEAWPAWCSGVCQGTGTARGAGIPG